MRLSAIGEIRIFIWVSCTTFLWWFFRSYLFLMVLLLLAVFAVLGGISLYSARNSLALRMDKPSHSVGKDTDFALEMRIENPRKFVWFTAELAYHIENIFTGTRERKKHRLFVQPGKGCEVRQMVKSQYVGRIELRIDSFVIYDLLHLFYLEGMQMQDTGVIVYPFSESVEGEEVYSYVDGFPKENETKKRGTDYNPDYEVREYIPGDELKSIHWKLSAKRDELMVRQRLASGREKINILLPLEEDKACNDGLVASLYSLGQLLLYKEYPMEIYWCGTGNELRAMYVAELGELEAVINEILSGYGVHAPGSAQAQMQLEHPGEAYIIIQTGAYKGAYIR